MPKPFPPAGLRCLQCSARATASIAAACGREGLPRPARQQQAPQTRPGAGMAAASGAGTAAARASGLRRMLQRKPASALCCRCSSFQGKSSGLYRVQMCLRGSPFTGPTKPTVYPPRVDRQSFRQVCWIVYRCDQCCTLPCARRVVDGRSNQELRKRNGAQGVALHAHPPPPPTADCAVQIFKVWPSFERSKCHPGKYPQTQEHACVSHTHFGGQVCGRCCVLGCLPAPL